MAALTRSKQDWQVTKGSVKERFKELLTLSQWTDCTFAVGEEEEIIQCHKLVLAVSSPVFEALFFGGLGNPEEVIRVPDMDPYIFKLLLKYIYSDSLDLHSVDEAGGLLYAAKKYLMPQLSRLCLDYLVENTCIKTLWDVLPVAEALDEQELIIPCLKVMCRYPYDVWWEPERRLSTRTVALLAEQRCMNQSESELWSMLVEWARGECSARGLPPSPSALRSLLAPALRSLRFLLFTPSQIAEEVGPSQVLTSREVDALTAAVLASDPTLVPPGFSTCTEKRFRMSQVTWQCGREVVGRGRAWLYGGLVGTRLSSSSRVLVTGFEVFTRVAPQTEMIRPPPLTTYRERLALFLKDTDGNVLAKTDHDSSVEFNSLQVVSLSRPVWLMPSVVYIVLFELSSGQYPLVSFADTAISKRTTFTFDDSFEPSHHSKVSFINSVLYSL